MGTRKPRPPGDEPGATRQAFDQVLWEQELWDAKFDYWVRELLLATMFMVSAVAFWLLW